MYVVVCFLVDFCSVDFGVIVVGFDGEQFFG